MFAILSLTAFAVAALAGPIPDGPTLGLELGTPSIDSEFVDPPDLSQVYINSISYGGTGCPQGSVDKFIPADRHTFTLSFDSMVASIGSSVAVTENRKACQINLNLHYPAGFQYSVFNTEFRGYADIPSGVTGVQQATYYFSRLAAQGTAELDMTGPYNKDYTEENNVKITSIVWSPCGQSLPINIKTQVRLTGNPGSSSGLLTQGSADGNIRWIAGVQWQKCNSTGH